jgi:hypothetical protein
MITDALLLADPYLKISDAVDRGDTLILLTDGILREIEKSTSDELAASREIIYDIRRRNLYRFVDGIILSTELRDKVTKNHVTPASIIQFHDGTSTLKVRMKEGALSYSLTLVQPTESIAFGLYRNMM